LKKRWCVAVAAFSDKRRSKRHRTPTAKATAAKVIVRRVAPATSARRSLSYSFFHL
jgi:hypothetical protein